MLLLPLEKSDVSELTVSFRAGQWDQVRYGESGPLSYEAGGAGGEIRGWIAGNHTDKAWDDVTHAMAGLFCATVGSDDIGESVRTFGSLYPAARSSRDLSHYINSSPHLGLCTENLTPFLSLLPSKGLSGLSALLAQPHVVLSWGFKTEGIEVVMPEGDQPGKWTGWWEGIVDLVPKEGGSRDFSISSLFKQNLPRPFARASSSNLRLIKPKGGNNVDIPPKFTSKQWIDGSIREILDWDLLDSSLAGKDLHFTFGESHFSYRRFSSNPLTPARHFSPPPITVSRVAADRHASDATFVVEIANNGDVDRKAVYSEVWPWWVKGWLSEMEVSVHPQSSQPILHSVDYHPSVPPTPTTTDLHLRLTLPARSTVRITLPFTKLTLKYTDHVPDAERGREIPASVLTLLDLEGEGPDDSPAGTVNVLRSSRRRIFGPKLLLDVPTPDFSMPYNVIIMTSTVMAVFFGSMQGRLIRRWGWVPNKTKKD